MIFTICIGATAFAIDFKLESCGIESINVPDEYMICTQDLCDEKFNVLLANNNFSHSTWVSQVMKPNNYFLYACDAKDPSNCMYVVLEKGEIQETITNKDGSKTHKLMKDYNLLSEGDEKDKLINQTKEALIYQGVSQENISKIGWVKTESKLVTPYIEYICRSGNDYIYCFETIYNGNKLQLQFSSKKPFTKKNEESFTNILSQISYSEIVDYTEVNKIIYNNLQKKLEEETHSGENTKIIRYIISISIAFVIVFAIYLSLKTQSKRRGYVVKDFENKTNGNKTKDE